jgi:hypothetical protein
VAHWTRRYLPTPMHPTSLILANSVCLLYSAALAALGLAVVVFPWYIPIVLGLWAAAIALALHYRWAFWPAYAMATLFLAQAVGDGLAMRVPLRNLFHGNIARHYLLESPAVLMLSHGIPKPLTQIALCTLAIAALAWSYLTLAGQGALRSWSDPQGARRFATILSIASKLTLVLALLVIAYAFMKDPPTGGHNPGGPSGGYWAIIAIFVAGPWAFAGAAGWTLAAWLRRRST